MIDKYEHIRKIIRQVVQSTLYKEVKIVNSLITDIKEYLKG
jgi:hypothetical protein